MLGTGFYFGSLQIRSRMRVSEQRRCLRPGFTSSELLQGLGCAWPPRALSQAPGSVPFLPVWMPIPGFWGCPAAWGVQESPRTSVPWGWGLAYPSALLLLLGRDAAGPLDAALCAPRFCGECLQPCLQVPSPLCPLCRMPFDPKKVEKASSVEKQLSSYKAPCRGCSKKVTLAKMRSHVSSCAKVQEQMANCPKFVPVVPTSQPIPSNIPNRSTFVCPYCGARNLDQQELVKHCMENHRNDPNKVVCPVCSAMPWGDPSYKSANFLQHLLHRHKFSYDTFVDYNIDEEAALQAALALSLSEN
ncbi:E3 ubiquitin-protein ligase RNF166 isoform X1 [Harpia harpyja]|uniref:E3 ubiquitin-protein ligase RNF166 isoform X1 n=1 Tax=Harpia harpyja TaxID=202280 RepID=UPI0022B082D8|nr:E3 ubiquitin-protein ligase RNF166 isoform X1 [Harpia harpyja]